GPQQRADHSALGGWALALKQARIPRLAGLRRLGRRQRIVSVLLRGEQSDLYPAHGVHGSPSLLPGGSRRRGGSEHPDSDFTGGFVSTATRPPNGRRSADADSTPATDRSTAGRYARFGRADAQRRSRRS